MVPNRKNITAFPVRKENPHRIIFSLPVSIKDSRNFVKPQCVVRFNSYSKEHNPQMVSN